MENAQESKCLLPPVRLDVTVSALFQEVGSPWTAEHLVKVWTGALGRMVRWGDRQWCKQRHRLMEHLMWHIPQTLTKRFWVENMCKDLKSRVILLIIWKVGSWNHWHFHLFTQQVYLGWLTCVRCWGLKGTETWLHLKLTPSHLHM